MYRFDRLLKYKKMLRLKCLMTLYTVSKEFPSCTAIFVLTALYIHDKKQQKSFFTLIFFYYCIIHYYTFNYMQCNTQLPLLILFTICLYYLFTSRYLHSINSSSSCSNLDIIQKTFNYN